MDKTFNDLMDIVNRTKKIDGDSRPKPRTRTIIEEEPDDEYAPREYDIEEPRKSRKAKDSHFNEESAISKLLDGKTKKKSTTKKTTSKTATKKAPQKKTQKTTPKKEKETKVEEKKAPVKKTVAPKTQPTISTPNYNDPKNAQLYEALQNSLLRGGTDISEYMKEDTEFAETQVNLQDLRA